MKTTITFELETNIREQLAAICSRYNLSLEEAFTLFAATVVQAGRFPYDMEVPNAVTQAAMAAAEKGEGLSGTFDSAPELMVALGYTRGNSRRYTLEELDNEEDDAEMDRRISSVAFEAYQRAKMKGIPVTRYDAERRVAYLMGLCHQLSYQISANRRKNISPTIGKALHNP